MQDYQNFVQYESSHDLKPSTLCVNHVAYVPVILRCDVYIAVHKPLSQTLLLFITWLSILSSTCARL